MIAVAFDRVRWVVFATAHKWLNYDTPTIGPVDRTSGVSIPLVTCTILCCLSFVAEEARKKRESVSKQIVLDKTRRVAEVSAQPGAR